MDINNLHSGMVVKNYKELCKLLGIKITSGEAKRNQLNKLKEYVEFESQKQKFIIQKIIKLPTAEIKPQKQSYIKLIETLLIARLIGESNGYGVYTYHQLMNILYMASPTFNGIYSNSNYEFISNNVVPVDYKTYVDFRNNAYPLIKRKIKYALDSMQRRQLINYKEEQYVCVIDEDGNRVFREPTVEEIMVTLKIGQELLMKYHCHDTTEVNDKKLRLRFEQERQKRQKEELGWEFTFNKVIIYKYFSFPDYTLDQSKRILYTEAKKENLTVNEQELNRAISGMMNQIGLNNHRRAEEKLKELYDSEWNYNAMNQPKKIQYLEHQANGAYLNEWKALTSYFIDGNGGMAKELMDEACSETLDQYCDEDDLDFDAQQG